VSRRRQPRDEYGNHIGVDGALRDPWRHRVLDPTRSNTVRGQRTLVLTFKAERLLLQESLDRIGQAQYQAGAQ
jgi:hypothetical protein